MIRKNTELVIEKFGPSSGINFGLNRESVEWIESYIERERARVDFDLDEDADDLVGGLGSFLGECIIAKAGGEWRLSETQGLGIAFPGGNFCYPFNKVRKVFRDGVESDSLLSFYDLNVDLVSKGSFWRESSPE
jgi:hypothetical protein